MKAWFTFSDGRREPAVPHEEGGTVRIPKEELSGEIRQSPLAVPSVQTTQGQDLTVDISLLPPTWHIQKRPCGTVFI